MFVTLIIFRPEIPNINYKKKENILTNHQERKILINDKDSFEKSYKFKTNLLLSTKLTIFINLDELGN